MRAILAASPFPIVIARRSDDSVLFANPQAEALFGTEGSRLALTRNARFFVYPSDAARLSRLVAEQGAASDLEMEMRTAGGRSFWAMISAVEIHDVDEPAVLIAVNDITLRKRSEEETEAAKQRAEGALADLRDTQAHLIQAEKMASLGGMVAGVAHEVNTPVGIALTGITHLADQTRKVVREVEANTLRRADFTGYLTTAGEACRLIESNLNRAAELIQSFKQTAVDQTSEERRRVDLAAYLDDVLTSLRPRLKQTPHRVVVDCPAGLWVDSYPGALFQVLTNLTMNAVVHAYPDGRAGTLTVAVTHPNPQEVELRFCDDGCGIPAANLGRVFDPFFTTRRGEGGSGLGLHIVYNIVTTRLRGSIRVDSREDGGTCFVLRFPAEAPPAVDSGGPAAVRPEPVA
nr:HAMP domain-containing sensor histidine kinase [Azospirillum brasilense]